NDYPEEAFFLANNEQKWLSEIHGMAIQGSEDWYAIFITPGYQHLVVNVLFNHSYGNIDIALYQVWDKYNINYITGNSSLDDNEHLEVYGLTPGPYVIQIYGDSWGNEYDLWWDDLRTDFRTEDNYEENDIALAAYDLTHEIEYWDDYGIWGKWLRHISDIGIQSDNDWFKINVAAGTQFLQLRVFVLYEYSEAPIGLELYDGDLTKLTSNFTTRDNEYLIYDLPSNGTYYIRIYGDNSGSPYDLRWELREVEKEMIPGYDIFILLGAIFGVSTVISIRRKRSKKEL
ncbi:MAG: Loki-CTERM sorting domain-containing protein, partial [Candidatus Hermodarchaeota archaeon]